MFFFSGKNQEPKPKLFGPDIFGWGGGLPRERVGAEKFGMSFETQGYQTFWRDIPGFCRDIPGVPEKFEQKRFVFNSRPLFLTPKRSYHWGQNYYIPFFFCFGELFSVIITGNFTACNSWEN